MCFFLLIEGALGYLFTRGFLFMRNLCLGASLFAFAVGCEATLVDIPFDEDQDGLLSNEEEELGTDPLEADSDGDGHYDGDEFFGGTDPMDADDHPYMGGWDVTRWDDIICPRRTVQMIPISTLMLIY